MKVYFQKNIPRHDTISRRLANSKRAINIKNKVLLIDKIQIKLRYSKRILKSVQLSYVLIEFD